MLDDPLRELAEQYPSPPPLSQPAAPGSLVAGQGHLGAVVWPTYMGVSTGDPGLGPIAMHEPYGDINYSRGQITWHTQPDGDVLGSAQVFAPKGVYTHFLFCHGPAALVIGNRRIDQPIVFDRPGIIDIEPIRNQDHLPRQKF